MSFFVIAGLVVLVIVIVPVPIIFCCCREPVKPEGGEDETEQEVRPKVVRPRDDGDFADDEQSSESALVEEDQDVPLSIVKGREGDGEVEVRIPEVQPPQKEQVVEPVTEDSQAEPVLPIVKPAEPVVVKPAEEPVVVKPAEPLHVKVEPVVTAAIEEDGDIDDETTVLRYFKVLQAHRRKDFRAACGPFMWVPQDKHAIRGILDDAHRWHLGLLKATKRGKPLPTWKEGRMKSLQGWGPENQAFFDEHVSVALQTL